MTVSTTQNRKTYAGDGVSVVFAFPYKFLAASDLLVYLNGTLQTLTTHYSVGTPSDSGANVTFVTAPANGASVQVVSDPDQLQSAALPSTGPFPSVTVERMSDKLTLLVQRCRDLISRSFRLADSDVSGASTILPTPSSLNLLGWDVLGTSLQNFSASQVGVSIASANWSTSTFNGTGAVVDFVLPTDAGVASNCAVSVGGVVQAAGINFNYTQATKTITFLTGAPPAGTNNVVVRYGVAVPQGLVGNAVLTGGSIDGTPIGEDTPSTGAFTNVQVGTPKFKARNLFAAKIPNYLPSRADFRAVMASPPATTYTTAHTIASPLLWPAVSSSDGGATTRVEGSSFSYFKAGGQVVNGTVFPNYQYIKFTNVDYGSTQFGSPYQVSFMHDGAELEISVKGQTGQILAKIDGKYISLTAQTIANDGSVSFFYIPFGSRALRRIDVMIYNSPFGGVYTGQTDTIYPVAAHGPRTVVLGDSFTEPTGATNLHWGWAGVFADYLGWDDVWASGVGSTGYLAAPNPKVKFRDRIDTDVVPFSPEVVIIAGGLNDNGTATASVQTEARALFQALSAQLPYALLVAVAPFWKGGASTIPVSIAGIKDAIKTEIEAVGGVFIDPLEMPLPLNTVPHTTTLSTSTAIGATSIVVPSNPVLNGTYKWADGTRFKVKAVSGSGPFTITAESTQITAHTAGETITQVGDCFWNGSGKVGATTGYGNADLFVGSDGTHPTQAGHDALGSLVASLLVQKLATL